MIVSEFKPCCRECGEIEINYDTDKMDYITGEKVAHSRIYCEHQAVCKQYIECSEEPNKI